MFLDAEHFFDGYRSNRGLRPRGAAKPRPRPAPTSPRSATPTAACCPTRSRRRSTTSCAAPASGVGIHCHNDTGCAVANSLSAVDAGATHVQGTLNGYGERTGNADLVTVVANLELKRGRPVLPAGRAAARRPASRTPCREVTNVPPYSRQPYVGTSAFAHKAGLHASAVRVDPMLYQHADPESVGNDMRMLVSEMAGRATIEIKGRELGFDLAGDRDLVGRVTDRVKELEARGYTFEAADASFELLLREEVEGARPTSSRSSRGGPSSSRAATATGTPSRPPPRPP